MTDFRQLQAFQKRIEVTANNFDTFLNIATNKMANKLLADLIEATPINKNEKAPTRGQLRRNWQLTPVKGNGRIRSFKAYNNTRYASWVENGHRKRNGTGWVEGQFFMRNTLNKFNEEKEGFLQNELNNYLNATLYRGRSK